MPESDSDSDHGLEQSEALAVKKKSLNDDNITEELEKKIQELKLTNKSLQDRNKSLQDQFESHTSKRKQSGEPEEPIIEAFSSIFKGIETFVSETTSRPGFRSAFKSRFEQYLNDKKGGKKDHFIDFQLFKNINWRQLGKLGSCATVVLSLMISLQVFKRLLKPRNASKYGRIYPIGTRKADMDSIKNLHLNSTSESRKWRQGAVRGLMFAPGFKKNVRQETDAAIKRIDEDFEKWTGERLSEKERKSLKDKVINRAVNALTLINSSREYVYVGGDRYRVLPHDMSKCEVVNISDWSKIHLEDTLDIFHCLYPGLARKENDVDPFLVLVNPTVLGYKTPDLQPRIKDTSRRNSQSLRSAQDARSVLQKHPIIDYVIGSPSRKGRKR